MPRIAADLANRLPDGRRRPLTGKFRQEACQLSSPAWLERIDELLLIHDLAGAESVHPGREGKDALGLVAPPDQHASLPPGGGRHHLGHQAALADTCFPNQGDQAPAAGQGALQRPLETRQSLIASDERRLPGAGRFRRRRLRPAQGRDRRLGLALSVGQAASVSTQDLLVEGLRLRLGLGPELSLEVRHAALILAEGGASLPRLHV